MRLRRKTQDRERRGENDKWEGSGRVGDNSQSREESQIAVLSIVFHREKRMGKGQTRQTAKEEESD